MKREALLRFLRSEGDELKREGGSHSIWISPGGKMQAVPRHTDVEEYLARAICRKLGIADPTRRER